MMSASDHSSADLVAALRALATNATVSRRRVREAAAIADRLGQPARVTLIGPASGPQWAVARGLLGEDVGADDWPTTQIDYGAEAGYDVTCSDRRTHSGAGRLTINMVDGTPVFVRLTLPLPTLRDKSLLVVRPSGGPADLAAALRWAAPRTDVVVWCSRGPTPDEIATLQSAPPDLQNHVFGAFAAGASPVANADAFDACFAEADGGGCARLGAALSDLIAVANGEDAAAAQLFLSELGLGQTAGHPVSEARSPDAVPAPAGEAVEPPNALDPEARSGMSRLFLQLRRAAKGLLPHSSSDERSDPDPDVILVVVEDALAEADETCRCDDTVRAAAPALCSAVSEAAEMAVLLRCEGGPEQAASAAALLLQIRTEIEPYFVEAA